MRWMVQDVLQDVHTGANPFASATVFPPSACNNMLDPVHTGESPSNVAAGSQPIAVDGGCTKDSIICLVTLSRE